MGQIKFQLEYIIFLPEWTPFPPDGKHSRKNETPHDRNEKYSSRMNRVAIGINLKNTGINHIRRGMRLIPVVIGLISAVLKRDFISQSRHYG